MTLLSMIQDLVSDPAGYLPIVQEKGQHVLDLVKSHPWTSLGVATGTALLWSYVRAPRNLPPGPTNYPIIGATSCFSGDLAAKMVEWRPIYGEIVSYYALGQLQIVLNSDRIIREAFVKRQDEFSHRVEHRLLETVGLKDDIFTAPFNETWKKNKKFALSTLKTFGFGTPKSEERIYEQIDQFESFLMKSKGNPIDVSEKIRFLRAGEISSIVLGGSSSWEDPEIADLVEVALAWVQGLSNCHMLPFTKVSPTLAKLVGWRTFKEFATLQTALAGHIKRRIESHATGISERDASDVVDAYLQERGTDAETIERVTHTIQVILPDAIDTSSIMDDWILFLLTYNTKIQRKLQEEVDSVCGQNRRPLLADRAEMHYTQAVIHETIRKFIVLPLSLPRVLKENVTLDGYNLPKGAFVSANLFGCNNDPDVFENPEKFDPSRFIKDDGTFDTTLASKLTSFNIGSRKCIGEPFFKVTAFLFLARLVQHFNISFDPSAPAPSTEKSEDFFIPKPTSFKLCFTPR